MSDTLPSQPTPAILIYDDGSAQVVADLPKEEILDLLLAVLRRAAAR